MTLKEILERKAQIKKELETRKATITKDEIVALSKELDELEQEQRKLEEAEAERRSTLERLANGMIPEARRVRFLNGDVEGEGEQRAEQENREYRLAFLKHLKGDALNEVESRALTTIAADKAVLPLTTSVSLLEHIKKKTSILEKTSLTHIKGRVSLYLMGSDDTVGVHEEGKEVKPDAFKPIKVELSGYEMIKPVEISKSVSNMSVDGFESWLVESLADVIARSIENFIINGTGTNQPTGIEKASAWSEKNSITIAAADKLKNENVLGLIALLPSYYDANANFVMSKKTLFTDIMPLKDDAKNNIVRFENGKYYIYGYEVELNDNVKLHEFYLGDIKTIGANLSEEMEVQKEFVMNNQTFRFFGVATFDCKPARADAFVKMVKGV